MTPIIIIQGNESAFLPSDAPENAIFIVQCDPGDAAEDIYLPGQVSTDDAFSSVTPDTLRVITKNGDEFKDCGSVPLS